MAQRMRPQLASRPKTAALNRLEQTLTARIGDAGKRLHTGRSRNDQVALDIRLTLRDYSHTLQAYIVELVKVICKKAAENTTAVMPGYTPVSYTHLLSYRGEALAFRKAFPLRQRLPSIGELSSECETERLFYRKAKN